MRLLFLGDIVGNGGRQMVRDHLPRLRHELGLDVVLANGENASGGMGISALVSHWLGGRTSDCKQWVVGGIFRSPKDSFLFIGASNQLGEFESGATAALFGVIPAVIIGGAGTLVVVALWMRWFPELSRRDKLVA